jgi:hypothetical protein
VTVIAGSRIDFPEGSGTGHASGISHGASPIFPPILDFRPVAVEGIRDAKIAAQERDQT